MFGVGAQEMVLIGILCFVVFGPSRLPEIARDIGRFVAQARDLADEYKAEFNLTKDPEPEEYGGDWEEDWDEEPEASWDQLSEEGMKPDAIEEIFGEEPDARPEAPVMKHEHLAGEVS